MVFLASGKACRAIMVDKPGRRKKTGPNVKKIMAVVLAVIIIGAVGWYSYTVFTVKPTPPVYVRVTTGYSNGTSLGSFELELFPQYAPKTVSNFVSLVNSGFYNGLTWHRIEKNFVIQTGDPNTKNGSGVRSQWGQGTSGKFVPFENSTALHNYQWYIGMASTGAGVGGSSQWYINLINNTSLDGKYAVFGKVINGTNVVVEIGNVPTEAVGGQDEPVKPVLITSAVVLNGVST